MEYKTVKLSELLVNFDSKRIPLSSRERAQKQGKYPYYGATSILDYVDEYLFDGSYILLGEDGTVMNPDGSPVLQRVSGKFWLNNHAHILKNTDKVDFDFLYYLLKNTKVTGAVTGAVQPKISQKNLYAIEATIPTSLETQKQIAAYLLALDNKISLNTAINNNLEQQAQALFKSWFIDFEPFGGTMPDDWEERALTDIPYFTLLKPGISSFDGEKYYVATADADEDGITNKTTFVTMQNKPSRANMQPLVDSVWFAKMKNSRKNILINELWAEEIHKFILSTGFYGFACQPNTLYFLWCFVASDAFDEMKNNLCNGTTMEAINNDGLGQITLTVPPLEIIQKFNDTVSAMFKQISQNKFENEHLAAVRDVLLPKLMNGEIDVSKVDISDPTCLDKSLFNKESE